MNQQTVFLEGKHIGVTGANGFLGSHIISRLKKRRAIIHAFVFPNTDTTVINTDVSVSVLIKETCDITHILISHTVTTKLDKLRHLST